MAERSRSDMQSRKVLSQPLRRKEDRRLLTGAGRFVDDVKLEHMLHLATVRSAYAHARILAIDKTDALAVPGVVEVIVPGDYAELDLPLPEILEPGTLSNPYCDLHLTNPHYVLARGKATFQGEPVAMVVAESKHAAALGAEAVRVEYEELPAVHSAEQAMASGAPRVHDANPNVIGHLKVAIGDLDAAFRQADFVIEERLCIQRLASMPIEGRGIVAAWDARREEMTVWSTDQVPYRLRDALARMLEVHYDRVRIISGDIGGAFGGKGLIAEDLAAAAVSRRLRRPVKWIESRSENFVSAHARHQFHDVRVAARNDGIVLGMDLKIVKDVGAYNHYEMVQTTNTVNHVLSHYKVPAFRAEGWCVVTNKVQTRPTRGAGRPEASFVMDRVLDFVAARSGIDPLEVRLRNIIPANEMPYSNGLTYRDNVPITYDGGDYPHMLRLAAGRLGYVDWRKRQAQARQSGRLVGIGISSSLEAGGVGPCEGARGLHLIQTCGHDCLGVIIKRTGGLVKEQNTRPVNNRARDHDALALPPGEGTRTITDHGIHAHRHFLDVLIQTDHARGLPRMLKREVCRTDDVVENVRGHQLATLQDHAKLAPQRVEVQIHDILFVIVNSPGDASDCLDAGLPQNAEMVFYERGRK